MVSKQGASAVSEIARNNQDLEKEELVSVDIFEVVLASMNRIGDCLNWPVIVKTVRNSLRTIKIFSRLK